MNPWFDVLGGVGRVRICALDDAQSRPAAGGSRAFWLPKLRDELRHAGGPGAFQVEIKFAKSGAPQIQIDGRGLPVSFSMTQGFRACARAETGRVGIDIEAVRRYPEAEQMLGMITSEQELRNIERLVDDRDELVLRLWTAKEATLKALGKGLSVEPRTVMISNLNGDRASAEVGIDTFEVEWIRTPRWIAAVTHMTLQAPVGDGS